MSPYIEDQPHDPHDQVFEAVDHVTLTLTPLAEFSSSSLSHSITDEDNASSGPASLTQENTEQVLVNTFGDAIHRVSLEFNLKELLTTVAGTEDLESVTQISLRVITREVTLQQLGMYLPALRELILDGSIISSLRDLGCGLKNLKVLKVNRCELSCIDGVLGFDSLKELYAADNKILDLTPCAFLTNIKIIDIRRNSIKYLHSLSFLKLCPYLENLCFEGNLPFDSFPGYRRAIKRILPNLKVLDERPLQEDLINPEEYNNHLDNFDYENSNQIAHNNDREVLNSNLGRSSLPRTRQLQNNALPSNGFIVRFPPRVFTNRSNHNNNSNNNSGNNDGFENDNV